MNPTVEPSVTITSTSLNICTNNGESVTFSATPVNGGSSPTYQWKNNGSNIPGATGATYTTSSLPANSVISVEMTSNETCPLPAKVLSEEIEMTTYSGNPSNWTGNTGKIILPASICPPATIEMSIDPVSNAEYYVWTLPQGFSIASGEGTNDITVSIGTNAIVGNNQSVTVQAFNPCGSNNSKTEKINVNSFTGVTVPSETESLCAGNSIEVVGTLTGNAASGTWSAPTGSGTFTNQVTSGTNPTTVTATFTPSITEGTVDLTITTNAPTGNGCSNSPGIAKIKLTVNEPSTAPTSLSPTNSTICNGESTTLTQSGGSLGTGANWVWYSDSGFTNAVGTNTEADASLQLNPTSTTTYYLRAESSTGAPCESNVEATGSVEVIVKDPSVAPTSITASDSTICNGDSTTLTQTGGSLGTGANWVWYSDAGYTNPVGISTGVDASLQVNPTETTTYYLRAESSTGVPCEANVEAISSVEVIVNDTSTAPTGLAASKNTICNGESTFLTQTGGSLGTGADWVWYSDSGYTNEVGTSTDTDASIQVSPTGTTTYYLRAESSTGVPCEANVEATGSVEVIVNDPSVAPTGLTASGNTICNGDSTTLTQSGGSLGTGANWIWYADSGYTNAVGTSTEADASILLNPTSTTTYYLRAESSTGAPCEANVEATGSVEVIVNDPSIAPESITASNTTICNGDSTTLTQSGGSLGTGANWVWYADSGYTNAVGTSTEADASLLLNPTSTTTYYLRAESSTGAPCEANVEAVESVEVIVNDPVAIITDLDDSEPYSLCVGFPISFSIEATGSNLTFEWTKDTQPVGTDSPNFEISQVDLSDAGLYEVTVVGSCGQEISKTVELIVNQSITIPTEGQPTAEINSCQGDTNPITISVDAQGTISEYLWRKDGIPLSNSANISGVYESTLTISNQSVTDSGVYDVVITSPDGSCSQIISKKSVVTVSEPPSVNAGIDIQACSTDSTIAIGGDASASNYSALEWTTSGTGTFGDATALATNYIPGTGETGQVTLTLTAQPNAGCSEVSDDVIVTITNLAIINTFTYTETEFCVSINTAQSPSLDISNATTNDGAFSYSGDSGNTLDLNTITGDVNPANSDPGTYTITYEIPSDGICTAVSETFDLIITPLPVADFSYTESPFCSNSANPIPTMGTGAVKGIFSSTAGLVFTDDNTGEIDIAGSTPGTYTVRNTIAAAGGCEEVFEESTITITKLPIADFTYDSSPYCSNSSNPVVTLGTDAEHGEYSSTTGLVFVDTATGEIDIAASTPDTYTVTNTLVAANGCEQVTATADITITKLPVANFSYAGLDENNAACISSLALSIETESAPDPNGTYSSETLGSFLNETTGELTWELTSNITSEDHTITYTIPASEGCPQVSYSETIKIDALPVGGALAWDNEERIFLTCEVQTNTLNEVLSLSGESGTVVEWEYRTVSNPIWQTYASQNTSLDKTDFESILGNSVESTVFRIRIGNGACSDPGNPIYSQTAILSVIPDDIKPSPVESDPDVLCYNELVTLSSETGYGAEAGKFEGGAFDNAGIKNSDWRFPAGYFDGAANNGRADHWLRMNPHGQDDTANEKVYTAYLAPDYTESPTNGRMVNFDTYVDPAGNKGFAIVTGDHNSVMETPAFSLGSLDEAVLTFDQAYNLTAGASIKVEISKDGGANYIETVLEVIGTATSNHYESFGEDGPGDRSKNKIKIDLGDYIGQPNLRIRFTFDGKIDGDVWAVDNIKVPEGPQKVQLIWYYDEDLSDPDNDLEQIGQVNQSTVSYPQNGNAWPKLGWNDFEVRTALLLDSNGDPCESINNFETVQVFVFDEYTTTVVAEAGECGNKIVNLSATISGEFQGDVTEDFTNLDINQTTVDGYTGYWEITGGSDYTLTNPEGTPNGILPENNPNAMFEAKNLGNYTFTYQLTPTAVYPDNYKDETLRGEIVENLGCPPVGNSVEVQMPDCSTLDFDGDDDYIDLGNNYNGNYFIEAWIRPFDRPIDGGGITDASTGVIFSSAGFEITMDQLSSKINTNDRWYHIAVSKGGALWIDGVPSGTISTNGSGINNTSIGARYNANTKTTSNHFSGWIEELRIWNGDSAPDLKELRFMMNQRIKLNGAATANTLIEGEVVPNLEIADGFSSYYTKNGHNLDQDGNEFYNQTWGDLAGYYRLYS